MGLVLFGCLGFYSSTGKDPCQIFSHDVFRQKLLSVETTLTVGAAPKDYIAATAGVS